MENNMVCKPDPQYIPEAHQCDCSICPANIDCPGYNTQVETLRLGTRVTDLERKVINMKIKERLKYQT